MLKGVLGIFGPITTLLIILKLVGVIHWGWVWVLLPSWAPLVIGLIGVLLLSGSEK